MLAQKYVLKSTLPLEIRNTKCQNHLPKGFIFQVKVMLRKFRSFEGVMASWHTLNTNICPEVAGYSELVEDQHRGLPAWSQTMVSEWARLWGRGRSTFAKKRSAHMLQKTTKSMCARRLHPQDD